MACKPDSVLRSCPRMDDHSSWPCVATTPLAANPNLSGSSVPAAVSFRTRPARGSYLALLPVGLAMPSRVPGPRWARTPPFHPYLPQSPLANHRCNRRSVLCGAIPWVTPAGRYPAPCFVESGLSSFASPHPRSPSHPRKRWLKRGSGSGQPGNDAPDRGRRRCHRVIQAPAPMAGNAAGRRPTGHHRAGQDHSRKTADRP